MKKNQRSSIKLNPIAAWIVAAISSQLLVSLAYGNAGYGVNTDISGNTIAVPTYYANSPQGWQPALTAANLPIINPATGNPYTAAEACAANIAANPNLPCTSGVAVPMVNTGAPLRKFVDPLAGAYYGVDGLPTAGIPMGIPVAIPDQWVDANGNAVNGNTDVYYEIAVVEYQEQMHSDLAKPTRLRGYVQIETPNIVNKGLKDQTGIIGSEHIPGAYLNGQPILDANGNQVYFVHAPHYLGPTILAQRGKAVRILFHNYLPYTDVNGNSVGSITGNGGELPIPVDEHIAGGGPIVDANGSPYLINGKPAKFPQNRVSIHWHGGDSPWTNDGTPHQWFVPAGDVAWTLKDATHPYGLGRGDSFQNVPDMPDPGPGSQTLYFPTNLSGRLMFYHDHASGLTKLNVYDGEAAGYSVYDPVELNLVANALGTTLTATTTIPSGPAAGASLPTGLLDSIGIPLVIQDKTFVPKNMGPSAMATNGQVQSQDTKWNLSHWGQEGDLYFPHVYEVNQDPNSIDGTNPVGRWDWGPWFWPVFPAQYSLPSGDYGDVTQTPEAFVDTPTVNGQAYPTLTVDPKTYRFRILGVGNDRSFNLGLYQAVDGKGVVCDANNPQPAPNPVAPGQTAAPATCTEIRMVSAAATSTYIDPVTKVATTITLPPTWPTDGRAGGVPDPRTAGPDIVQIGNEAGLLPAPAIWPAQPVTFDQNVRSMTIFNILNHQLLLGGAERGDVLIDFSKYAGQTLIIYNDAPAPMPGYDPRLDYFTGVGDQTQGGGAYDTLPGYGPNTRTILQIKVSAKTPAAPLDTKALAAALPVAYAATQPQPNIPEKVYDQAFGTTSVNNYAQIFTGSATTAGQFTYTDMSTGTPVTKSVRVINKAIQELFDPVYGRMNATLAVELPFSSATVATTIPLAYIDAPIDNIDSIADGETQIWKITHNGVDSHPVHFHLVNVQVLNRVDWAGVVKPPEANEVGWKETLRMNPLEDVYVAVTAKHPVTPFGLPRSQRPLDPSQSVGSQLGFTQIDQNTGNAPTYQTYLVNGVMTNVPSTTYSNQFTDFDNEYVWHCHILGHEENDFMRPFVFHPNVVAPDAPANVAVNGSTVTWVDPTPFGGQDAQGIPTAGTNAAYPTPTSSPKNEIGFLVQQSTDGGTTYSTVASLPANQTSWTDAAGALVSGGLVQVVAYNAVGSAAGTSSSTSTAGAITAAAPAPTTSTAWTPTATSSAPPAVPTGLTQTLNPDGSVTLSWNAVAGATSYIVNYGAGLSVTVAAPATSYTFPAGTVIGTFTVAAVGAGGQSASSSSLASGAPSVPVAVSANPNGAPNTGSITLTWANNPANVNNVASIMLSWVDTQAGGAAVTKTFTAQSTGVTVDTLVSGHPYSFTIQATAPSGSNFANSAPVTVSATPY